MGLLTYIVIAYGYMCVVFIPAIEGNPKCHTGVFSHTGVCYWYESVSHNWTDAWMDCYKNNGRLVVIYDEKTHNYLDSNLPMNSKYWIGLSDGVAEAVFRWSNTRAAQSRWQKWAGAPAGYVENNCVFRNSKGDWKTQQCSETMSYVCQSYNASISMYQCTDLTQGCLGVRPEVWTLQPGCPTGAEYVTYTTPGLTVDTCKQLCSHRIDFYCRYIKFSSGTCRLLKTHITDNNELLQLTKFTTATCGSGEKFYKRDIYRVNGPVCYQTFPRESHVSWDNSFKYCHQQNGSRAEIITYDDAKFFEDQRKNHDYGLKSYSSLMKFYYQYRYTDDNTYPELMFFRELSYNNKDQYLKFHLVSDYFIHYHTDSGYTSGTIDILCEKSQDMVCLKTVTDATTGRASFSAQYNVTTGLTIVTVTCKDGYRFGDNSKQKFFDCQALHSTGSSSGWCTNFTHTVTQSTSGLACIAIDCGLSSNVTFASMSSSTGTVYTNTSTYTCDLGHYFSDSSASQTITCMANGTWSAIDQCYPIDCRSPPPLLFAAITAKDGTHYPNTTSYQCYKGYYHTDGNNSQSISCLPNGNWSNIQNCYVADCGPPSAIAYGNLTYTGTEYTNMTQYTCDTGYYFSNGSQVNQVHCNSSRIWSGMDLCEVGDCGPPPNITHTTKNISGTEYTQTTQYDCSQGYHFPNESLSNTIICQADKQWGNVKYCQPRSCGSPVPKQNRAYVASSTGHTYTHKTAYRCNRGHFFPKMSSAQTSVCLHNGTWSPIELCIPLDCGLPPNITSYNAEIYSSLGTYFTYSITYFCSKGFSFIDQDPVKKIHCQIDGNWTIPEKCNELPNRTDELPLLVCPDPPQLKNIYIQEEYSISSGYTVYGCKPGFEFPDGTVIRSMICLDIVPPKWHEKFIDCKPKQCSSNPVQQSGACNTASSDAGTVLQCSCKDDSLALNTGLSANTVKCGDSGQWSADIGDCNARCPPIPLVENSKVTSYTGKHWIGSVVQITCMEGYKFNDGGTDKTINCNADLTWDEVGNCKLTRCSFLTTPSNATKNTSSSEFGTVANVSCELGWTFSPGNWTIITQCLTSGNWSVPIIPQCKEIHCLDIPSDPNADQIGNTTSYGSVIQYKCVEAAQGSMRHETGQVSVAIVCEQNSQWSTTSMSCQVGRCAPIPVIVNSQADNNNATDGSIVTYTANTGFQFVGGSNHVAIQCKNMQWNASLIRTEDLKCPPVPDIQYATTNSDDNTYYSVVNITCDTGYTITNTSFDKLLTIRCGDMGQWEIMSDITVIPQQCSYITCESLPAINYAITPANFTRHYSSSVQYTCLNGYWFRRGVYSQLVTCGEQAEWMPVLSNCSAITCLALPVWSGLVTNTTATAIGTRVNATCTYDFQQQELVFSDNKNTIVSLCSKHGEWTPAISECIVKVAVAFTPIPSEAQNAGYCGLVAVAIIGALMLVILLMDIVTVAIKLKDKHNTTSKQ